MSSTTPIPRQVRRSDVLIATAGQTLFGPFLFRIFDSADVQVLTRDPTATNPAWAVAPGHTVTLTESGAYSLFLVTFATGLAAGTEVQVFGRRLHSRLSDVTKGGALQGAAVELELDKQAVILSEMRSDLNLVVSPEFEANLLQFTTDAESAQTAAEAARDLADADAVATAADRVQTGLDRTAAEAARDLADADAVATAADRVQTGLDRSATEAARDAAGVSANTASTKADEASTDADDAAAAAATATTKAGEASTDATATAADRVQTGLDRAAAAASASAAASSATLASNELAATAAVELLRGERAGVAFAFDARSAVVLDPDGSNTAGGAPEDIGTFTRAAPSFYFDADGILKSATNNVMVYDHDPILGQPGWAQFGAAQDNLLLYSDEFNQLANPSGFLTITQNAATGPDGLMTADKIAPPASGSFPRLFSTVVNGTSVAGRYYSGMLAAKKAERDFVTLNMATTAFNSSRFLNVDLRDGSFTASSTLAHASVRELPDDWWLLHMVSVADNSNGNLQYTIYPSDSLTDVDATGNGSDGIFLSKAAFSEGYGIGPFVPTSGAAASGVNASLSVPMANMPSMAAGEFTMFGKFRRLNHPPATISLDIMRLNGAGTDQYRIYIGATALSTVACYCVIDGQGLNIGSGAGVFDIGDEVAIAVSISNARKEKIVSLNGVQLGPTLTFTGTPDLSTGELLIGASNGFGTAFQNAGVITRALNIADLNALTGAL